MDGEETTVTASTLDLKDAQISTFFSNLLNNLNKNENFQLGLGNYKEDVQAYLNETIQNMGVAENIEMVFTIYTKGLLNEFVGISASAINTSYNETIGFEVLKYNDNKYVYTAYMNAPEEDSTISISGDVTKSEKNYNGNVELAIEQPEYGTVKLNCAYSFTLDVEVQKTDVTNSTLINEISEEDEAELVNNLQNSALYSIIELSGLSDAMIDTSSYDEPYVYYDEYFVTYDIPDGFKASSYNSDDMKMYLDEDYNYVTVYIDSNGVDAYMNSLENEYVLTSNLYKNQTISDVREYTVDEIVYQFRTITYEDEYDSYVNLYFAHELGDGYCYIVEVETEGGNLSMSTVREFLDISY